MANIDLDYDQIKNEIARIKRSRRFYDWRSRGDLYYQLDNVLQATRTNIVDSVQGVELMIKFFALDATCCNNCDDSDGGLTDIFNYEAVDVFKIFTDKYQDKAKLADICYKLINNDAYGLHNGILNNLKDILPPECIANLLERDYQYSYIKLDLAFALRDAPLFETMLEGRRTNSDYSRLAKCYIDYGDLDKALSFANKMDQGHAEYNKSDLLEEIYIIKKDNEALKNLYCKDYLIKADDKLEKKIIALLGAAFFADILQTRVEQVMASPSFSQDEFLFLMKKVNVEAAEEYLLARKDKIDNQYFERPFLNQVKKKCSPLAQTVVFRVPLNFYLNNAKSKYYSTAANYLKYLIELSVKVTNWKDVQPHWEYFQELHSKHYRKQAFWYYF